MKKPTPIKSRITSALRQIWWRYSEARKQALNRVKVSRGRYQCELCDHITGPKGIQVDHIIPCRVPGDDSWDGFIKRLFCSQENLRAICKGCHKEETDKQRKLRSKAKGKKHV